MEKQVAFNSALVWFQFHRYRTPGTGICEVLPLSSITNQALHVDIGMLHRFVYGYELWESSGVPYDALSVTNNQQFFTFIHNSAMERYISPLPIHWYLHCYTVCGEFWCMFLLTSPGDGSRAEECCAGFRISYRYIQEAGLMSGGLIDHGESIFHKSSDNTISYSIQVGKY